LAGALNGVEPVWCSEIEPYPIAVTRSRFPNMKHYGDVSKVNGTEVEPVDIITFGSPCQDLSIAGKREGIEDGARSSLFFQAVRIIKEMRGATNGVYPNYAIWENVPGAFSSNKGNDFRLVLEALASVSDPEVSIPMPEKWQRAGEIVGDGWSIAWRTLDAQFWGVPQRRKRIYLVADFGSERAGEILFEPESVRGDTAPSGTARKGITDNVEGSAGRSGVRCLNSDHPQSSRIYDADGVYPCLSSNASGGLNRQAVCYPAIARTLEHRYDSSPCIDRGQNVICLQANGIDCADAAGCKGSGWRENESYTLNTVDRHGVVYPNVTGTLCASGAGMNRPAGQGNEADMCVVFSRQRSDELVENTVASCQSARQYKDATDLVVRRKQRKYIVRRLTPTECARLQGFPDTWGELAPYDGDDAFWQGVYKTACEIKGSRYMPKKDLRKWYNGLHTDSAEYKMWGNGIALPCAEYVIRSIKRRAQ
jgi:DNA (cytosine-5)-methyltransferase 1